MDRNDIKIEYDSPFSFNTMIDQIGKAIAEKTDEQVMKAVWRCGIDVDKETLEQALIQDKRRYGEAYIRGYDSGYKKREDEIIRCRDCSKKGNSYLCRFDRDLEEYGSHRTEADDNWYCADAERRQEPEDETAE